MGLGRVKVIKQVVQGGLKGLQQGGNLHALQTAFIEHDGFQCGFCTSGQIMSAVAVIEEAQAGWPSAATEDARKPFALRDLSKTEIRERMSGNLCRGACYPSFALSRADDPANAITAHAQNPHLAFIAGGYRPERADKGSCDASRASPGYQPPAG
jgi:xanthine dehydrogenase iron-sulfur cluster and FAD-binding subunit A